MGSTDSASSIKTAPSVSKWPKSIEGRKVFDADLFDVYVARIVRKHIASQFLEEDNPVILDEIQLISEAQAKLQKHLSETVPGWKLSWRVCKMIVTQHIRRMSKDRLEMHDVDEETKEITLEKIKHEDYESLWPRDWMDS